MICETDPENSCFEKAATIAGCNADRSNFSLSVYRKTRTNTQHEKIAKSGLDSLKSYDTTAAFIEDHAVSAFSALLNV